jgi:hypothetical protein
MDSIRYLETLHAIVMPPLLKMHLKGPPAPIRIITTNLTFILNAQSMQFEQPVRNGLAIPT